MRRRCHYLLEDNTLSGLIALDFLLSDKWSMGISCDKYAYL